MLLCLLPEAICCTNESVIDGLLSDHAELRKNYFIPTWHGSASGNIVDKLSLLVEPGGWLWAKVIMGEFDSGRVRF